MLRANQEGLEAVDVAPSHRLAGTQGNFVMDETVLEGREPTHLLRLITTEDI